jgi:hypothetical protein
MEQRLPDDPIEARRIVQRSKAFTIVDGDLYKRSISGIFQRASPSMMVRLYCEKYTRGHAIIMPVAEHLWLKLSELGSIGQQRQPMQET